MFWKQSIPLVKQVTECVCVQRLQHPALPGPTGFCVWAPRAAPSPPRPLDSSSAVTPSEQMNQIPTEQPGAESGLSTDYLFSQEPHH